MNASDIDTKEALMGTRTYSEQRQAILFKAAADLYKLAKTIGDENTDPPARRSVQSAIDHIDTLGRLIEDLGHEATQASRRDENRLYRLRAAVQTRENMELRARIVASVKGFNVTEAYGPRAADCIECAVTDAMITGSVGATHSYGGEGYEDSSATVARKDKPVANPTEAKNKARRLAGPSEAELRNREGV